MLFFKKAVCPFGQTAFHLKKNVNRSNLCFSPEKRQGSEAAGSELYPHFVVAVFTVLQVE